MPAYTEGGRWHLGEDAWAPMWTGGFFAGLLWILAEAQPASGWRKEAERYSGLLKRFASDPEQSHSIGFIFTPSWSRWHAVAPSDETREVIVEAGREMAKSFNLEGRYLRTWVDPGSTFIDMMMMLDLLYEAASLSGDDTLAEVATAHALTTRRYLVRGDASTVHEGWFDPISGEFLRAATHQGFRPDSTWTRGQTWAIYGFGSAFRWTGDPRFLDTARRCADLYIENVGDRFVGPNDLNATEAGLPYESSAAAIAASAMLQLSEFDNGESPYRRYAIGILNRLSQPDFFEVGNTTYEGILKHAIYHLRRGVGVNESVMWGDYYFAEALDRLRRSATVAESH